MIFVHYTREEADPGALISSAVLHSSTVHAGVRPLPSAQLHNQQKPGTEVSQVIFKYKSPDDLLRQYSELF